MKLDYNGHVVYVYDSIDDMPVKRWHEYSRWMLMSPLDADQDNYVSHIQDMLRAAQVQDLVGVQNAAKNFLAMIQLAQEDGSPSSLKALACLTTSIDGVNCLDKPTEEVCEILKSTMITKGILFNALDFIKKKLRLNGSKYSLKSRLA